LKEHPTKWRSLGMRLLFDVQLCSNKEGGLEGLGDGRRLMWMMWVIK